MFCDILNKPAKVQNFTIAKQKKTFRNEKKRKENMNKHQIICSWYFYITERAMLMQICELNFKSYETRFEYSKTTRDKSERIERTS